MVADALQRLLPGPPATEPLTGCYLGQGLDVLGTPRNPFVYTNFIQTLDGRVAVRDPGSGRLDVPAAAANSRDWRLFQELAAQADVLITSGRHLRAVAAGRRIGLVDLPEDLRLWRRERGMPERPAVAAVTTGGDWLEEAGLAEALQRALPAPLWVITPSTVPDSAVASLQAAGVAVVRVAEKNRVPGETLIRGLAGHGFARLYSIAGPGLCHALADSGLLDRLYLTQAHVVVGGEEYETLARGPLLRPGLGLRLAELRLDAGALGGAGQMFQVLKRF